jgi:hypothetical protein
MMVTVRGRFQKSLDASDANASDPDGKWRLSTPASADFAFFGALFSGWVGWAVLAVCGSALALLIYWVF